MLRNGICDAIPTFGLPLLKGEDLVTVAEVVLLLKGKSLSSLSRTRLEELVRLCMAEVDVAIGEGNKPMACVITDAAGEVLVAAHNTQNTDHDPTAHAEINALRALGKKLGRRYFDGCHIVANAESCSMCASALIKAHIFHFHYGAPAETSMDPWLPLAEVAARSRNTIVIDSGILAEDCAAQMVRGREVLARGR